MSRGGAPEVTANAPEVDVTPQALTTVDIDRVLDFEAASVSDWSIIQSGPGTLGISTTRSQGSRSLAVAAHGYVPVQSVALPSLGSRVGSVIHYDIMSPSNLKQLSPGYYGATQLYVSIPSLGLNNAYLGQVELTPLPLGQWNTVSLTPPSSVLARLRASYTDLRVTIVVNAPYNATNPYLLDNLRFSDKTLALVGVSDGSGHPLSGLTVVAYNGSTPTANTGVTDSAGVARISVPPGSYRFGVTEAGVTTYSSPTNQCQVPGVCAAATIVVKCHGIVCTAQDQCHSVGTCDANTGVCSNPPKDDGTACSDGNACTLADTCRGGTCAAGNPATCEPPDGCHDPGTCDKATGSCSNPVNPNGPACGIPDGWTPSTPLVLQAVALSSGVVRLTWTDVDGENAYYVIRSKDGGNQFVQANQSPAGTTTWDDTSRALLTTYCYKVRAKSAAGYATSNMACVETPLTFEAENQTRSASDGAIAVVSDTTASAGKYTKAPLAGVASWVEYLLDVPVTGTFRVKVRMATGPDRGRWRLQVDGKDASMEMDGYAAQPGNTEVDLGEVKIDNTSAQKHFRFLVTGKGASSSGYVVAMDAFALFNVGLRYEGENSGPVVSTDDSESNAADTGASNGKVASTTLDAVGDFLQFTLSVPAPGKYQVVLRYKTGPDRGIFQARLDNSTDLGAAIDAYSASPGYATQVLAIVDIASAGSHTVTLQVTGKSGGSTGYGITVDYIELRPNPVVNKIAIGTEPVTLEATFGCGTQPDPQTKSGTADPAVAVSFTIPDQIPMIVGNAGDQQATLVFRNGATPAVTCTYQGATVAHPTTKLEYVKGLKYQFQGCSNGAQSGGLASATHFELSLLGVDCQDSLPVAKARVQLGAGQCSDAVTDFISPDDTYTMRTQFSWTATRPVAETKADGTPTLWYALMYIHDERQPDALDSLLIHHQKLPIFFAPDQTLPRLCGKLGSTGDGEGSFEYALLTGVELNKLRALALAAGADMGAQGLFKVIKIITPPVAGAANADGSVSVNYLKSAGFRYMGYLAGETVTHPDGTTEVIGRPSWYNPLSWPGEIYDDAKAGGEWVLGEIGQLQDLFWPHATASVHLRAISDDPVFRGQPLRSGWGLNAGQEIGVPGVRVNLWYISLSVASPFGGNTDALGQLTVEVPKWDYFIGAEIQLNNDAAKITWNGMMTYTLTDTPDHLNWVTGDTTTEIDDSTYINVLAQLSDGRDYLQKIVGYTPHKVKVATGFAVDTLAEVNNGNAVTTCATFPNLVFYGTTFTSWMLDAVLAVTFPPALLVAVPFEEALDSDMWLPTGDSTVFRSRGIWTHEYGHYALCSMISDQGYSDALSTLTQMTVEQISEGKSIDPGDETRILNEAFADFFAAQVVGGTNYYTDPSVPPGSVPSDHINYCIASPCLEKNRSQTGTGHQVIARDITVFMDAFDGEEGSVVPDAGDSWSLSTADPQTLGYASQKYANSCLAGRADTNNDYYSTCDEPVEISGRGIHQWIENWLALSHDLNHTSFMIALANTARTNSNSTWCDLCRLFAIHTPGNEASPQDLGRTTPIPITQYSDACLSSPIKDWIGPPPDPSLTNLDRVFDPGPYICMVCPVGSTPGPDRCICGAHQIPSGFSGLGCSQCAAGEIAVLLGLNWYCAACGDGAPIDGQNACQCNPGKTQAANGTCVSACGAHEVWQGGQCVDCAAPGSYPDPTGTMCLSCPAYCIAYVDGKCYGNCTGGCAPCHLDPEPGSVICGAFTEAFGCSL